MPLESLPGVAGLDGLPWWLTGLIALAVVGYPYFRAYLGYRTKMKEIDKEKIW